jgi:two-component system, NarL family, sensor histidine kinase EvgS
MEDSLRKLLVILSALICLASLSAERIKIGYFGLEPFMIDSGTVGKPTGATIDYYSQYIAPKMGVEIEWIGPYPFTRLQAMLEAHEIDAIAQLTKTAEREKKFLFPATAIAEITTCLILAKDSPIVSVKKPDDLFGKKIGYFETGFVPAFLKNDKIAFDLTTNADYRKINLDKLLYKRFDAMLDINYLSMLYYIKTNGYQDKVRTIVLPVDPVKVFCMFGGDEKGKRLAALYDKANEELLKASTFASLTKKYID